MQFIRIAVVCMLLPFLASADDVTRSVQEALRSRKLYYGEVDGVQGAETTEAVRRFQEKRGFDPTGALDETTLRALGVLPHAGLEAPGSERVEQSRDFVDRYLHACQSGSLAAELTFYAERVDYMAEGVQRKADLKGALAQYRESWPERHFELMHCVASPSPSDPDEMIATFRYKFDVRGGGHDRKGVEDLNVVIRAVGGELKIISIKEFQ